MMATIHYDIATPSGRAIQHLLDTVLADQMGEGIDVRWLPAAASCDGASRRLLVIHSSMPRDEHVEATGALLMLVESLAGTGSVNLQHLYALTNPDQREQIAIANFMAAGLHVGVPAGKRAAS